MEKEKASEVYEDAVYHCNRLFAKLKTLENASQTGLDDMEEPVYILMFESIEHLSTIRAGLDELSDHLKIAGLLSEARKRIRANSAAMENITEHGKTIDDITIVYRFVHSNAPLEDFTVQESDSGIQVLVTRDTKPSPSRYSVSVFLDPAIVTRKVKTDPEAGNGKGITPMDFDKAVNPLKEVIALLDVHQRAFTGENPSPGLPMPESIEISIYAIKCRAENALAALEGLQGEVAHAKAE